MLGEALTTAQILALTSDSAATRSRSTWSMIAMSPGRSRFVSRLVRRSIRAGPTTPGGLSPPRGRRRVASLISRQSARPLQVVLSAAPPRMPPRTRRRRSARLEGGDHLEQLYRMAAPESGVGEPGEHPRELLQPLRPVHPLH